MPLLQLLGLPHDELFHLFILATERCGKLLLTRGKVLLLGVQRGLCWVQAASAVAAKLSAVS